MGCGIYSPCQNLATKSKLGISFSISSYLFYIKWNSLSSWLRRFLSHINKWLRTWHGQDFTWGALCHVLFLRRYLNMCCWQQPSLRFISPPWLPLFPNIVLLLGILWTTWIVWNSGIVWGRMYHIYVLKYWKMLITLRVLYILVLISSYISLASFRIIMVLDFTAGKIKSTIRLRSLLRNYVWVKKISCKLNISLPMGCLFKRLWVNTATLLTQSGGNPLISKKLLIQSFSSKSFHWVN